MNQTIYLYNKNTHTQNDILEESIITLKLTKNEFFKKSYGKGFILFNKLPKFSII